MRILALPSAVLVVACSSGSRGGLDRSIYSLDVCTQGRWDPLANVAPADPAEYIQLDVEESILGASPLKDVASKHGTSCAAATNPTTCNATIASMSSTTGWSSQTCGGAGCSTSLSYFVAEKAGAVTVISRIEDLVPLLLPIDSAADAALVAAYGERIGSIECPGPQVSARADGSFDVFVAVGGGPCSDRTEARVHVNVDGTTSIVEKTTIPATEQCVLP